jgi:hypothetical protein
VTGWACGCLVAGMLLAPAVRCAGACAHSQWRLWLPPHTQQGQGAGVVPGGGRGRDRHAGRREPQLRGRRGPAARHVCRQRVAVGAALPDHGELPRVHGRAGGARVCARGCWWGGVGREPAQKKQAEGSSGACGTHTPWQLRAHPAAPHNAHATQDDVFQNTFGFGRDSTKAAKELGDFGGAMFNAAAGEAAAPMEVRVCIAAVWDLIGVGGSGACSPSHCSSSCVLQGTSSSTHHNTPTPTPSPTTGGRGPRGAAAGRAARKGGRRGGENARQGRRRP